MHVECLIEDHEIGVSCGAAMGIHNECCLVCCIEMSVCRIQVNGVAMNNPLFCVVELYGASQVSVRAHLGLWCSGWVGRVVG